MGFIHKYLDQIQILVIWKVSLYELTWIIYEWAPGQTVSMKPGIWGILELQANWKWSSLEFEWTLKKTDLERTEQFEDYSYYAYQLCLVWSFNILHLKENDL